jgi:hypothetical protein
VRLFVEDDEARRADQPRKLWAPLLRTAASAPENTSRSVERHPLPGARRHRRLILTERRFSNHFFSTAKWRQECHDISGSNGRPPQPRVERNVGAAVQILEGKPPSPPPCQTKKCSSVCLFFFPLRSWPPAAPARRRPARFRIRALNGHDASAFLDSASTACPPLAKSVGVSASEQGRGCSAEADRAIPPHGEPRQIGERVRKLLRRQDRRAAKNTAGIVPAAKRSRKRWTMP